mmetsp:Transcript_25856/g.38240  ORF Transcript_25856/g.38240 Transcript_25856/m.38240 type:complete len:126 (+) Transcript_25856:4948-5325(+)
MQKEAIHLTSPIFSCMFFHCSENPSIIDDDDGNDDKLHMLVIPLHHILTTDELNELLKTIDTNREGKNNFDEFCIMIGVWIFSSLGMLSISISKFDKSTNSRNENKVKNQSRFQSHYSNRSLLPH